MSGFEPTGWLKRTRSLERPVTAVQVVCGRHHLVASVHPWPAAGVASTLVVWHRAARYRPGIAGYLAEGQPGQTETGWVTVPEYVRAIALDDFSAGVWAKHTTWACRCGLGLLHVDQVVSAAWSWSVERRAARAKPPAPRVVTLRSSPVQ